MTRIKTQRRWTLVAFKHPDEQKSIHYRQNIVDIVHAVKVAVIKGANLMSIRGFDIRVEYGDKFELEEGQEVIE